MRFAVVVVEPEGCKEGDWGDSLGLVGLASSCLSRDLLSTMPRPVALYVKQEGELEEYTGSFRVVAGATTPEIHLPDKLVIEEWSSETCHLNKEEDPRKP